MAELTEVIKQGLRMCEANEECRTCLLRDMILPHVNLCLFVKLRNMGAADIDKMERTVMGWAQAHPEPKYPSWRETWKNLFPDTRRKNPPCPKHFMDSERGAKYCDDCSFCDVCYNRPIPADIAEKLGIKPIGGGE